MQTLIHFFEQSVERFPDRIYMLEKPTGHSTYKESTYREMKDLVFCFAAGLMEWGLQKGDRVALLSEGRKVWVVSELAILYNGAINVPLSVKLMEPEEIRFRLIHSGVRMIIASGSQVQKIRPIRKNLPAMEHVILLDGQPEPDANESTFDEVMAAGKKFLTSSRDLFESRKNSVLPDDPANICYTSGTTADPKGIILTHKNYVTNILQGYSLMDVREYYRSLLILPWDHSFAHTAGIYCLMGKGASIASIQSGKTQMETLKNIPKNIKEIQPTILLSVPALAGNFKKNIEKAIHEKGKITEALFHHALKISYTYNGDGWIKGRGFSFLYKPLIWLYDKIIFKKIREGFGGRLEFFVGGGALLDIEYQWFFYAIGIPMFQGYGLTEAAPIISSNSKRKHKLGSSGYLVADLELKICDEKGNALPLGQKGEIVVKGDNVMKGYWNNEEATRNTIRNGWLYTGDLGYMDQDGFLYVLGRFKSLLIANDGEKFSPEGMEEAFIGHSLFMDQCMLYNNQNPYTVVLIVPNRENLKSYVIEKGLDPGTIEGRTAALVKIVQELQEYGPAGKYKGMFPQRWLPATVGILKEGFKEENQMLNSTLKMVRGKITEKYKDVLEFLYSPEAKNIVNKYNLEVMRELLTCF
jgi:long-chain acyl-CoA synthetase